MISPGCQEYGVMAGRFYLPVEARLEPRALESEIADLMAGSDDDYVFHPSIGLVRIEPRERLASPIYCDLHPVLKRTGTVLSRAVCRCGQLCWSSRTGCRPRRTFCSTRKMTLRQRTRGRYRSVPRPTEVHGAVQRGAVPSAVGWSVPCGDCSPGWGQGWRTSVAELELVLTGVNETSRWTDCCGCCRRIPTRGCGMRCLWKGRRDAGRTRRQRTDQEKCPIQPAATFRQRSRRYLGGVAATI